MDGVAAQAARSEARAQRSRRRGRVGVAQSLLRDDLAQQQRVRARVRRDERQRVGRAPGVEQPVRVRGTRVEVLRVGGQRGAEVRARGRVAAPVRELAQQRLAPRAARRVSRGKRRERIDLPDILEVPPFNEWGNVIEIAARFGGGKELRSAVTELQRLLYTA